MKSTWKLYGTDGQLVTMRGAEFGGIVMGESPVGAYGLPPIAVDEPRSSTRSAGSVRGRARKLGRVVSWPIIVNGHTEDEGTKLIARVARMLDSSSGDCRLVVSGDEGSEYDLVLTYTGGMQPDVTLLRDHGVAESTLIFRAFDPFWRSTTDTEQSISFPVTGSGVVATDWDADLDWDAPGLDWDGFDAGADGSTIATPSLECTAEAWPSWRFTGPLTRVEMHNATTGLTFDWSGVVTVGEVLSIGMAEDDTHVRVDGVDRWVGLSDESRMWFLKPGHPDNPQTNTILIKVTGADTNTTATMTYQQRFLSPPGLS